MKLLSTRVHGVIDYLMGVLLILLPFLGGFATGGAKQWVPIILGVAVIGQSLLTRYELGVIPVIPMSTHLMGDIVVGILLAVSPWLFGFADTVYVPHVILGIMEIGAGLVTRPVPDTAPVAEHRL